MVMAGSSYLRGTNGQTTSNEEYNWGTSIESEPETNDDLEQRDEYVFENGARYYGQWKGMCRHG